MFMRNICCSAFCRNSKKFCTHRSNKLLSIFHLYQSLAMQTPIRTLSVFDRFGRRRSTSSSTDPSNPKIISSKPAMIIRHSHDGKMFNMESFGLPKKQIGWRNRLLLKWNLGNDFDIDTFFDGAMGSFVHVTECIAQGKEEDLQDILIDSAVHAVTQIIDDAQVDKDPYVVDKNDIVVVKVTAIDFEPLEEFNGIRDVTVLSIYVWIAYMRDCIKVLESNNPGSDESWSSVAQALSELHKQMSELSHHAEFKFQRAYDRNLEAPLTEWMISQLVYRIPKPTEE